ncbi:MULTISPECIES: hypothetical protein [unclassified Mycolicibacterium]|uniref:hypothetical protein n=1 Tax=unclassified Mycolicibacterium TaxID=2636767 RepID=UPI001EE406D9|nr:MULTISPECIES: hypothetical protein [unclassified Mycolicibacterium]
MPQHDSQGTGTHRGGARSEHDAVDGGRRGELFFPTGQRPEFLVAAGGHDGDLTTPVVAPECGDCGDGALKFTGDPGRQGRAGIQGEEFDGATVSKRDGGRRSRLWVWLRLWRSRRRRYRGFGRAAATEDNNGCDGVCGQQAENSATREAQ